MLIILQTPTVGVMFSIAVTVVVFKLFVPDSVFPVAYSHGKSAHLDVSGKRGEAIKQAVQDQLGLEVTYLGHVGLAGSAGSTPLQMNVRRDADSPEATMIFAKLYAQSHLRADRWYKWGRTVVYGTLEDEVRFTSVRRLVEYEDYMMRVMRDAGIPCALPYGFVEITPEREYLIVTEFLDGAVEISEVELTDDQIDEGLEVIRNLWDAGLAHRDVKPANIMVRDGHVVLIDVAFGQVRPTPWRQAVDLANMMLVLALSSDAERVYAQALKYFSPDDVAEAFAATRSVSVPSQSRSMLRSVRKDKRIDLVQSFRDLAPAAGTYLDSALVSASNCDDGCHRHRNPDPHVVHHRQPYADKGSSDASSCLRGCASVLVLSALRRTAVRSQDPRVRRPDPGSRDKHHSHGAGCSRYGVHTLRRSASTGVATRACGSAQWPGLLHDRLRSNGTRFPQSHAAAVL